MTKPATITRLATGPLVYSSKVYLRLLTSCIGSYVRVLIGGALAEQCEANAGTHAYEPASDQKKR